MSAGAPWSVKGIDPKAREIAKDLAHRSGMTLGEWLNQMIFDDGSKREDGTETPRAHAPPTPAPRPLPPPRRPPPAAPQRRRPGPGAGRHRGPVQPPGSFRAPAD